MSNIEVSSGFSIEGYVSLEGYRHDELLAAYPDWDSLSKEAKLDRLAEPESSLSPTVTGETQNMVLDTFLEEHARGSADLPYLAIGDGTESPEPENETLNNEIWRTLVGRDEGNDNVRLTSTLLSSSEANGEAVAEIGFANDEYVLTHTVLPPGDRIDSKDPEMAVVIYYELQYQRRVM